MLRPLLLAALLGCALGAHVIDDYGAVAADSSNAAGWANTAALEQAMAAANASDDKTVLVPSGSAYTIFNVEAEGLHGVTLQIDGALHLSENRTEWPTTSAFGDLSALNFQDSSDLSVVGAGEVNGHGAGWWLNTILTGEDHRPLLLKFERCANVLVEGTPARVGRGGLSFLNSPFWHVKAHDVNGYTVRLVTILVDIQKQQALLDEAGLLARTADGTPIHPEMLELAEAAGLVASPAAKIHIKGGPLALNTDGLDIAAANVVVDDVHVTNWDDAVCPKPLNGGNTLAQCAENMQLGNIRTWWSVGLTIGSVPPNADVACVRNVTFSDAEMHHPLKGVYIKPNPGDSGSGVIDQITYADVTIKNAVWFPMYIGTQQQKQPDTEGTGCSFLYPLAGPCPTNPRVPISNVKLENVEMTGSLLWPGVISCNETAPCTGFEFVNVTNTGEFLLQDYYTVNNVFGTTENVVGPELAFEKEDTY